MTARRNTAAPATAAPRPRTRRPATPPPAALPAPPALIDITATATSFRTEVQVGTRGWRYLIRRRGHLIADTAWQPTAEAAAAAYAPLVAAIVATCVARYHDPADLD